MKISLNNINFRARNPEIRFADDIARRINTAYPTISPSNIKDRIGNQGEFRNLNRRMQKKIRCLRSNVREKGAEERGMAAIMLLIKEIKKQKVANCGEMADLSMIAAKLNGIKDCVKASLENQDGDNLDHAVLYVQNGKKPYIIDAWLGFADYIDGAKERYAKEFRRHFDLKLDENAKNLKFELNKYSKFGDIFTNEISKANLKSLKRKLPELIIKRKNW